MQHNLTTDYDGLYDITEVVRDEVRALGIQNGICIVYCPHTTAGITINENADPDVQRDILIGLDATFPDRSDFRHFEGNSAAHLKASAMGSSVTIIIREGALVLGTWQGIYFCEFDGPRSRQFYEQLLG